MHTTKVTGMTAIEYLTSYSLGEKALITEHDAGIDVDNGARGYDHESEVDYARVMWSVLLYITNALPDGWTVDDLFTADIIEGVRNGSTSGRVMWFHINENIFDGESRGTHFEFRYLRETQLLGYQVSEGDYWQFPNGDWELITGRRYKHGSSDMLIVETASGGWLINDESTYTVKRWLTSWT